MTDCGLFSSFVGDFRASLLNFVGGDLVVVAILDVVVFDGLAALVRDSMVGRLAVVEGVMVERRSLVDVGRVADGLVVVEDPRVDIRFETPFPTPVFFSSPDVTEPSAVASDVVRGPRPARFAVVDDVGRVGGLLSVLPGVGRVEVEEDFGVEEDFALAVELRCAAELPAAGLRGAVAVESVLGSSPRRTAGVLVGSAMIYEEL